MPQRYVKPGVFWRLIFVLIGLAYPAVYYGRVYSDAYSIFADWGLTSVCDALLAAFTLYRGYLVFRLEEPGVVWTFTWVLLLTSVCLFLDFFPDTRILLFGAFGCFIVFSTRLNSYSRGWDTKRNDRKSLEINEKEPQIHIGWRTPTLPLDTTIVTAEE